ncbi:uncharacterized protein [Montipora capricornis]|uniref:uncharacterized protein n=1 Tax=Montipora capricornis TaxID=246305 RepID=UPI0035F2104D
MPSSRCTVQGCSNISNHSAGISLHRSPASGAVRDQWLRFVRTHRANFAPRGIFVVCSEHFTENCFERGLHVDGSKRTIHSHAIPTVWKKGPEKLSSARSRRKIIKEILRAEKESSLGENDEDANKAAVAPHNQLTIQEILKAEMESSLDQNDEGANNEAAAVSPDQLSVFSSSALPMASESTELPSEHLCTPPTTSTPIVSSTFTHHDSTVVEESSNSLKKTPKETLKNATPCAKCEKLKKDKKKLQRKLKSMESKVEELSQKIIANQSEWAKTFLELNQSPEKLKGSTGTDTQTPASNGDLDDDELNEQPFCDDMEYEASQESNEKEIDEDPPWTPEETDSKYANTGDDDDTKEYDKPRLHCEGKSCREEPKGIVFLSKLLLLFQYCHLCLARHPHLSVTQTGTMLSIVSKCSSCDGTYIWKSQPYLLGKFPAGNILLSFAIICAGATVGKVLLVFRHMELLCYNECTYYYHQRHLLFPSIVKFWRSYQDGILQSLKGKEVVLAGDGRHDSMGHSAKYGTYTIFCCTIGLIIHIVLVQANEAGSSSGMEFLGHQKALAFLLGTGMVIKSFISDRHQSIAKWMREEYPKKCRELGKPLIDHFFDLWHIGKKIQKLLTKLSKEKGCEVIGRWKKACVRHFYWSVTSTTPKLGDVILAKFKAFLYHIINQHKDLPNEIFNKCAHGIITTPRLWMTKGSVAYEKLVEALTQNSLLKGIKQASPVAQTSCLEGYHSVVNQFAPKMLAYSYLGMLCRTILAAIHFNYNLTREPKVDKQGKPKLKVTYPKFKLGEATVREVRVAQNYDYVEELYATLIRTPREVLNRIQDELAEETPEALHTMLPDKEDKEAAKNNYHQRKAKETVLCPPTCSDAELQQIQQTTVVGQRRKSPMCRKCGNPRRGHKKGQCSSTHSTYM